jgi:hypothetical protein
MLYVNTVDCHGISVNSLAVSEEYTLNRTTSIKRSCLVWFAAGGRATFEKIQIQELTLFSPVYFLFNGVRIEEYFWSQ